ncbi:hypothetical protein BDV93DRAFT_551941 [Ceratobasidium sp. AG-I]|nr:hypothetical protein BDV93DRAFT_551941 [Ceratobasidium sp. AG-I]
MSNSLPHDTPTKARVNPTDPSYHGTSVERSLDVLLQDTPEIPEVTLESLLSAVVPALSETDDDQVYSGLIASGSVDGRRSVWTCMTANPTSSTEAKGVIFGPLKTIFDQVVSAAGINGSRIKFDLKGSEELESDPTNSSRPDAYLRLSTSSFQNSRSQGDYWVDVVMPIEFKKGLNDAKCRDDLRKVVWRMHHIMRSDPRRRFVFGLTIENTSARLWFLDRSDIVTSEVFDIHKDWRTLARLFLSMARASSEELGFDSQCEAVRTQPHCYDFTFEKVENGTTIKTVYRTVSIISDLGATSLLGHGTRVWKVQKIVGGRPMDKFYALRDVWPHDDREAEHLIVQKVKEANPEDAIHLLTITDAEFVSVLYNGQRTLDNTL